MRIDEQVCALALANKLKELGVKQESIFYWHYSVYTKEDFKWELQFSLNLHKPFLNPDNFISAFTVAELINLLPQENERIGFGLELLNVAKLRGNKYYAACNSIEPSRDEIWWDNNIANAIAAMLIYLIENKLMEMPK